MLLSPFQCILLVKMKASLLVLENDGILSFSENPCTCLNLFDSVCHSFHWYWVSPKNGTENRAKLAVNCLWPLSITGIRFLGPKSPWTNAPWTFVPLDKALLGQMYQHGILTFTMIQLLINQQKVGTIPQQYLYIITHVYLNLIVSIV